MSFINVNLDDVSEQTVAPSGRYELQITSCTEMRSKKTDMPMLKVSLGFLGDNNFMNLNHFVNLPSENDDPDSAKFKALLLRRFLALFNVKYDSRGIDTEKLAMEMVGASAEAEVKQETLPPREDSTETIIVNKLVIPRLRNEEPATRLKKK